MTWEYRVLHEVHEVPGGTTEGTLSIVEAYYAKPGETRRTSSRVSLDRYTVDCSRCGNLVADEFLTTARSMADAHQCPDVVEMWSEPQAAAGETVEELVSDLVRMLRACWKPVLERAELPGEAKPRLPSWRVRATTTGGWTGGWYTETMGQAVDAFISARGPFHPGTQFEVKPGEGGA